MTCIWCRTRLGERMAQLEKRRSREERYVLLYHNSTQGCKKTIAAWAAGRCWWEWMRFAWAGAPLAFMPVI